MCPEVIRQKQIRVLCKVYPVISRALRRQVPIPAGQSLLLGFIWVGDSLDASSIVVSRIAKLLTRITEKL